MTPHPLLFTLEGAALALVLAFMLRDLVGDEGLLLAVAHRWIGIGSLAQGAHGVDSRMARLTYRVAALAHEDLEVVWHLPTDGALQVGLQILVVHHVK